MVRVAEHRFAHEFPEALGLRTCQRFRTAHQHQRVRFERPGIRGVQVGVFVRDESIAAVEPAAPAGELVLGRFDLQNDRLAPGGQPLQDPRAELFVPQAGVDRQVLQIECPRGCASRRRRRRRAPRSGRPAAGRADRRAPARGVPGCVSRTGERGVVNAPRLGETGVLRALQPPPSEGRCMFFHD